jgi:hypothetical protein
MSMQKIHKCNRLLGELVPKTEVLEQPQVNLICYKF